MAKIITITTNFDKEMHVYQSETEDDVVNLLKWIYTTYTDIREIKFKKIQKWLATKTAEKLIKNQKPPVLECSANFN